MHSQIAFVVELRENRVRNSADAHLQRGAVLDQRGHVLTDLHFHRRGRLHRNLQQLFFRLHEIIHLTCVQEAVAEGTRHSGVHQSDHDSRRFRAGFAYRNFDTETHEAVAVRGGYVDQRHVDRPVSAAN